MTGPGQIPEDVWDAVQRAGELAEDLADRGERIRFDTHGLTGRVVATLMGADGRAQRRLDLGEVVGLDPDPLPAA